MKNLFLIGILLMAFISPSFCQQITIFDREGAAKAYIDYDEDATIFLWNGKPTAFLEREGSDLCVFGFNGEFLGWYEDGIIYDEDGYIVGAREGAVNMITQIEPIKSIQEITPIKPITSITPIQPIWKSSCSSTSLVEFLYQGKY